MTRLKVIFESGNRLVHGEQGEVVGPATYVVVQWMHVRERESVT